MQRYPAAIVGGLIAGIVTSVAMTVGRKSGLLTKTLDRDAVDFVRRELGVRGFYSSATPDGLAHAQRYDVIVTDNLFGVCLIKDGVEVVTYPVLPFRLIEHPAHAAFFLTPRGLTHGLARHPAPAPSG